jgi:Na+-transporting NADH:ubiquinone oxidoreductase subunit NqrC
MKRTLSILSILSLAFVMTVAAFSQTTSATQTKPEHLGKRQLNTLIATAKSPAEHRRIAQYYQAKAQDLLAQSKEHEQMVAAYKANPSLTAKSQASTINHCEYFVQTFKDLAAKSQELAQLHDQMAKDAELK